MGSHSVIQRDNRYRPIPDAADAAPASSSGVDEADRTGTAVSAGYDETFYFSGPFRMRSYHILGQS